MSICFQIKIGTKMVVKIHINDSEKIITEITEKDFFAIEKYLIDNNLASDKDDAETIKSRLKKTPILQADEFAKEVIYVILASGFSQKTAKKKFTEITYYLNKLGNKNPTLDALLKIFNNTNKMSAVLKIWNNRQQITVDYYKIKTDENKMIYLKSLPFIGTITVNHIARNLGINTVKPDVWIIRLATALNISYEKMFAKIANNTDLPIGYIDIILWKACQIGIIKFEK
jgi:hypothetical protein